MGHINDIIRSIIIILPVFLGCQHKQSDHIESKSDSLKNQVLILSAEKDSLSRMVKELHNNSYYWFDPQYHGEPFKKRGIHNPEEYIDSSLRANPGLIPIKAVLGGTMAFGKIQILSSKWLIADYSDGHILGRGIYEYKLNNKHVLVFKLLLSLEE